MRVASEVDSVRSHLVLLEKSTVDTLRSENEVRVSPLRELAQGQPNAWLCVWACVLKHELTSWSPCGNVCSCTAV